MPEYKDISLTTSAGVLTITLDRPERLNALTLDSIDELIDAFDVADADDDVRAVVVTGNGRAFCAGADLSGGGDTFDPAIHEAVQRVEDHRDGGGRLVLRIFNSLKPVIAAVNGPAVGLGATMTLPMDIRLAAEDARFGFVFARRGIVPDACSSWFLPRAVGVSRALEWATTGRVFPATEALSAGLVRSLHPVSVALTRQMMWRLPNFAEPTSAHLVDSALMFAMGQSVDSREGVEAFLEKRAPHFRMKVSTDLPESFPWWQGSGLPKSD